MTDYEDLILEMQECANDDCASCPHKGKCENQCIGKEELHWNPYLLRYVNEIGI